MIRSKKNKNKNNIFGTVYQRLYNGHIFEPEIPLPRVFPKEINQCAKMYIQLYSLPHCLITMKAWEKKLQMSNNRGLTAFLVYLQNAMHPRKMMSRVCMYIHINYTK